MEQPETCLLWRKQWAGCRPGGGLKLIWRNKQRAGLPCNTHKGFPLATQKGFTMKKNLITAIALAAATLVSSNAFAQAKDGPWMVRLRAVNLASANTDSTGLGLSINDKVIPEVDISYFFNKNVAAELVLTVPQQHELSSSVLSAKLGTLSHLPPTLLLQYHFDANGFKPYIGAGVNFTQFSDVNLSPGVDIKRNSTGLAYQIGVDVPISGNMYFNFDVKKVYIGTDVSLNGANIGTFKVDPVLVGVGLGWRF